jgi:transposase
MRYLSDFDAIYIYRQFVDMRKSINGLAYIVEQEMHHNPFSNVLFVFCNQWRNRMKILYWDRTGYALWYKRLEEERFKWPKHLDGDVIKLSEEELKWLLEGYDLSKMKPHKNLQYQCIV